MKYNIFELPYPEPKKYNDNDIVWWKKGDEVGGFWWKAESPNLHIIELGDSLPEAINNVIREIEALEPEERKWRLNK